MTFIVSDSLKEKIDESILEDQFNEREVFIDCPIYIQLNKSNIEINEIIIDDKLTIDIIADRTNIEEILETNNSEFSVFIFDQVFLKGTYNSEMIQNISLIENQLINIKIVINDYERRQHDTCKK